MRKLITSPLYKTHKIFTNNLAGIDLRKSWLLLNKPLYVGMTILDNSKLLMHNVYYNLKATYGEKCELLYRHGQPTLGNRNRRHLGRHCRGHFNYDTSDYPKDHALYSAENKKVLGKMKDESSGMLITECV